MHQITRKIYILLKIVLIISKLVSIFYLLYIVINSCLSQVSDVACDAMEFDFIRIAVRVLAKFCRHVQIVDSAFMVHIL